MIVRLMIFGSRGRTAGISLTAGIRKISKDVSVISRELKRGIITFTEKVGKGCQDHQKAKP